MATLNMRGQIGEISTILSSSRISPDVRIRHEQVDIARQLGIAHRTVKACFNRLYLRFGITQRHQTGQACRASLPQPAMFSGNAGGATSKRLRTATSLCQARARGGYSSLGAPQPLKHVVTRP